ncbi:S-adenosyl-L-methionine-dependent methyltransferase [Cercophora newfieldiana]|uniref:S-adenosyl-L-methionine-dependent methyltransferase n=1 Tax=Cercophora newfieldiana TaxID=92897 RepID=A0AA39XSZ5_9PEZI|nr:S-adenosyl-L-methionine-dependent methyltransferase [Cercophora newfieldiana]
MALPSDPTSTTITDPTPTFSPKQYNTFATSYDHARGIPTLHVETANLRSAVTPFIHNARVLDLACGTGYYSRKLLSWGAASVVGVDVSEGMIAVAKEGLNYTEDKGRLEFRVGDARDLGVVGRGEYDLVTAVWLLNYARDEKEMRGMFEGIAGNLKEGGRFMGITLCPVKREEMDGLKGRMDGIREAKVRSWGVDVRYHEERLKGGGWGVTTDGGDVVKFVEFHLPMEVYEDSARKAGFKGAVEWREVVLEGEDREVAVEEAGMEFFDEYFGILGPHFGLLVVEK